MTDLREKFLTYFDHKGHHINASTALIPEGDPSLLFTAAGMVPFKPYFLGQKTGLNRATSSQKCFRTTDIDNVGMTVRHLTFFEMLGNFSFGDYFKEGAIDFAWEFLTEIVGLDPKRLHPTVFTDDDEAEKLWLKKGTPNRVIRLGAKDNFWAMGATGPCGPCSEIYYDMGPEMGTGPQDVVGGDGDRYIEIWNLVFMEFDRQADGTLTPLPKQNIDTGMGLERLSMVAEGKKSPFHTGLFLPIRDMAAGFLPGSKDVSDKERELAYRIISDHTRAAVMLASEGIIPSNVERGYVLRRLIRRASRYGRLLGAKEPLLHLLVDPALKIYEKQYPELAGARSQLKDTLRAEEERFLETLEKGERELADLLASSPKGISGEAAFKLYDTYGFPLELTKEICAARGILVDENTFGEAQERAVEKARSGWKGSGETSAARFEKLIQDNPGMLGKLSFDGYRKTDLTTSVACVIRARKSGDETVYESGPGQTLEPGDEGEVILLKSPFYAEGGGQVGDTGELLDDLQADKKIAVVHDCQKPRKDLFVLRVTAHRTIRSGMKIRAVVDPVRRKTIAYHHTATHLLNAALRDVLGTTVRQAGSLVAPDHLRFDFTHGRALSKDELSRVEAGVNEVIKKNYPVQAREMPVSEVTKFNAVTLLGENYGETPRFLLIGPKGWQDPMDRCSLELCGGTHTEATGEIERFKIIRESSVAAGIRRIEAVAGPALEEMQKKEVLAERQALKDNIHHFIIVTSKIQSVTGKPFRDVLTDIPDADEAPIAEIRKVLPGLKDLNKKLEDQLEHHKKEKLFQQAKVGAVLLEVNGRKLTVQKFEDVAPQSLRMLADQAKREMGTGVVFLASSESKRLSFVIGVTKDLIDEGLDASCIAKAIAEAQNGRAGGRADFAQGGGPDYDWESLVEKVKAFVKGS